ncbi:hypothetical protein GGQ97_000875 [Sphingomonas kaistensis]|uniref:YdhG-like domain-containing protein n=1 Tax=Sphingomonas kaistensis TaxID=298708 RepID=A0A7X5Y4L1_9SPHN|nr:DUF1801 domain-containing protein [Sphingomonas kaistensis]NJC05082.1 hypothetical protein [Sphingomonas kaistensis]
MAENKTKPTGADVTAFLDAVEHPTRRADGHALRALFERISGEPATLWGPSIIGFGSRHYRYDSGHEGDMPRIAFSPRKANLVFYLHYYDGYADDLARLGKHKAGKGCLYVTKLADVDGAVLEAMVRKAWESDGEACA